MSWGELGKLVSRQEVSRKVNWWVCLTRSVGLIVYCSVCQQLVGCASFVRRFFELKILVFCENDTVLTE